jgi:integrase
MTPTRRSEGTEPEKTSLHALERRSASAPDYSELAPKRRRGRPAGQKMRIAAENLRRHHFSFLRACLEGIDVRKAWELYLFFEGGPNDARHFEARRRELTQLVRLAASERGLAAQADLALGPSGQAPAPALPSPTLPPLDEFIAQRCEEDGTDPDFYRQVEWLEQYELAYGLDGRAAPMPATALPSPTGTPPERAPASTASPLQARLAALRDLADALSKPPALSDPLAAWLSADLAKRLAGTVVDGRALPIVTLANLIDFVNLYHHRWWTRVPRLGQDRARRLVQWLTPLAEALGQSLGEQARLPYSHRSLVERRTLELVAAPSPTVSSSELDRRYGLVPLTRLAVPPELAGRDGTFRAAGENTWGADTDLEAIFCWLQRHRKTPRTFGTYGRIVERFYLWCLLVRRKALSSLVEADFIAYEQFLADPPADWVQARAAVRHSRDWRPFKKPLAPSSRKLDFTVISGMLTAMSKAGYLRANAAESVVPGMKLPRSRLHIERSFDEAQWHWVMRCWSDQYRVVGPQVGDTDEVPFCPSDDHPDRAPSRAAGLRRIRLILELGATTGLRLIELVTTRRRSLTRQLVDGESVWILTVLGKGSKEREAVIYDDVKAMIDQHHRDMEWAGTHFDRDNRRVRHLDNPLSDALPAPAGATEYDPGQLPLVGALGRPPARWQLNPETGVRELVRKVPNADQHGSLDPTALYQALKRFFRHCGELAVRANADLDRDAFANASTHWLRHFFANSAAADNVAPVALMAAMGHASLQTTSVYLRAERKLLVRELSKVRRRG